ncbi:hypothetical protein JMA_31020 [Jeotgalibacillus malaysiensis]|uniref:Uncharacterized protein n=1 Tax=Jeotgalibacillus malaysiensis TaxID=1508404 RepID=A0A0B5AWP4_9BACL|nr:hypothetical protein JMA_31020 [Jeotgalibacillus malaysiensis]
MSKFRQIARDWAWVREGVWWRKNEKVIRKSVEMIDKSPEVT